MMNLSNDDVIFGTDMKAKTTIPRTMSAKYHLDMSKRHLPRPMVFWSDNERDAYRRNRTVQIRFNRTVDHLRIQHEFEYRNICDEERRFAQKYLPRYLTTGDKFDRRISSASGKIEYLSKRGMSMPHIHMASDDITCMKIIDYSKIKNVFPRRVSWASEVPRSDHVLLGEPFVSLTNKEMEAPSYGSHTFVPDLNKGNGRLSVLQLPRTFHSAHIRQGQYEHVRPGSHRDIPAIEMGHQILRKSQNHPGILVTSSFESKNRQEEEKRRILQHQENFLAYVKAMAEKHSRKPPIDVKSTVR